MSAKRWHCVKPGRQRICLQRAQQRFRAALSIEPLEARLPLTVTISEFMASNRDFPFTDEDGQHSDWIELHNSGPAAVDLTGWHLTDDPLRLDRWTFPSLTLQPDGYVVVFASGNDRLDANSPLHTNFKLDADGEFLALVESDGQTIVSQYGTLISNYPSQISDVSYGWTISVPLAQPGTFFMPTPSPGEANLPGVLGWIQDTRFSVDRGIYSAADLQAGGALSNGIEITAAADPGVPVQIYFTTDGSLPSPENPNARLYQTPVSITTTMILRAAAYADHYLPSNVDTHTYLVVEDVLQQDGAGLPPLTQTDYEMDPDVVQDPRYASLTDDLQALPSVSFVGDVEDLFGEQGIIQNPTRLGREWERPVSVEWIQADGALEFQEDAGLRIQGAGSRARAFSKKGFQLFFRSEYGAAKLDFPFFGSDRTNEHDRIAFRGNFFDSWTFNQPGTIGSACCGYNQALLLRDQFGHVTHEDMGALAIGGNWVHLYLNGQYWGLYNAVEPPNEDFAAAYLGGDADDYDVLKQRPRGQADGSPPEVVAGNLDAWNELMALVRQDTTSTDIYQQIADVLDVEQFADYILLNIFGGNFDWPHNNWYGIRNRNGGRWRFVSWDTENFIFDVTADRTEFSTNNSPGILYNRLRRNADFRLLFADRVRLHLFNDGALTPAVNAIRFRQLADEIQAGMNAESARWGDTHTSTPRNTIDTWLPVVQEKLTNYFPKRTEIVLRQLMDDGMYPALDAPEFYVDGTAQHGGTVPISSEIQLVQPSTSFIDKVLIDEGALASAYIPAEGEFADTQWTQIQFDPAADPRWSNQGITGPTGIGFDSSGDYSAWIQTDVSAMLDQSGSVLIRIPFQFSLDQEFQQLQFEARYDDAFVAYLNGTEIARSDNIRTQFPPQAARARNHAATETFESFQIANFRSLLVEGQNVLAIQAINVSSGSNDLLMVPRLIGRTPDLTVVNDDIWYTMDDSDPRDSATGLPAATARQFTAPLQVTAEQTVKSRVWDGTAWSAISVATFVSGTLGDVNQDGVVNVTDVDALSLAIRQGLTEYDLTNDGLVDQQDLAFLVQVVLQTNFGDANLDGVFNSSDLVQVFQTSEYEDNEFANSTWAEGDWDGDGEFGSSDLVLAFQAGAYSPAAQAQSTIRTDIATQEANDRSSPLFVDKRQDWATKSMRNVDILFDVRQSSCVFESIHPEHVENELWQIGLDRLFALPAFPSEIMTIGMRRPINWELER
ncbi:MAG: CotH kinase family protein [Planctomycetales bacterium]|nr:CotH kinase family protein [Planctomycetales bacterium]